MTHGEGHSEGGLLALALLALVAGVLAGLVGAIFRLCLAQADRLRDVLIARAHGWGAVGFLLLFAACAAATALAAWLVRPLRATCLGKRHPSRRSGVAWRASAGSFSFNSGEVLRWVARDRRWSGARS